MSGDEVVLVNEISRFGLRRMSVMRMGKPCDREAWMDRVPVEAWEDLAIIERCEKGLEIYHLDMVWHAREVVPFEFEKGKKVEGVLWWAGKALWEDRVMTIREAADLAAVRMWLSLGRWPGRALVKKIPEGATASVIVDGFGIELRLEQAEWMPDKFVAVL